MISIFAKPAFLNVNPGQPFKERKKPPKGHLIRVSSMIRGDQIADQIGARLNPESGYENDTNIYVKPYFQKNQSPEMDPDFRGRNVYLDIIDGHNLAFLAHRHPELKVIVCSNQDYKVMSNELSNEVVVIPQHHCNFERLVKPISKEIKKIGVIGTRGAYNFLPKELEQELNNRGMELVFYSKFFSRQDIIDFYMNIDLQLVWRPYKKILSNPLKIVNGASFGVPTIALDEKAFWELKGTYIPVGSFESFLIHLEVLRESVDLYPGYSEKCLVKAEEYHIEKIGEMYKELDK